MDQRLRKTVANHLNCNDENLVLSPCPTGKHNATYFIDGASRPLVLRLAPPDDPSQMLFYEYRMMRQEPALHNLIRRKTTIQVPEILIADFSHKRLDQDFLLMERLSGKPLSDRTGVNYETVNRIFCDVGQCLKQAHTITGEQYGYVGDHEPMEPQSDWASAFVVMWNKLLDDIEACGGYSNEEADFLRRLLDKHLLLFDRPVPASLLHMDVWGQNIMVGDDGTLTGLLDWDRALWGIPKSNLPSWITVESRSLPSGKDTASNETRRLRPKYDESFIFSTNFRNTSSFGVSGAA